MSKQKKLWLSLFVVSLLLFGTSPVFAALWDKQCQVAIEEVQRLQKEITVKKQELDVARVVAAIPMNFVADELKDSLRSNDRDQSVTDLKVLFHNMEFAVSNFSTLCLKNNRVSE